jgi:hypothetical protein
LINSIKQVGFAPAIQPANTNNIGRKLEFLVNVIPELGKLDMVDSEQNVKAVNLRQVFKKLIGRRS